VKRTKTKQPQNVEPYVPKQDTKIYIYIQKFPNRLTPTPYKIKKLNYGYIVDLLNKQNENNNTCQSA